MKKRNAVTAIVIMFICVAVYLNWNTIEVENDRKRLDENFGETNLVLTDGEAFPESTDTASVEGKEEKPSDDGNKKENAGEYFDEARIEKQKARDAAITTLKEAVEEDGVSQETRDKAAASIETISTNALSETRIETLVKAKEYEDCVALINDNGVSVIVSAPGEGLSASDITKIKDIVVNETNVLPSAIKIVEIN